MRKHVNIKWFDKSVVLVLLGYYLILLLSYVTAVFKPIYQYFKPSHPVAISLRIICIAVICIYSILVIILHKQKFPWKWTILSIFVCLFTLFSFLISPKVYDAASIGQYGIIHQWRLVSGTKDFLIKYASTIADFAFAICALFILPKVVNRPTQMLWLILPVLGICCLEMVYSIIKEKDLYIAVIQNPEDPLLAADGIGATFGNKEDWGAFLNLSFFSSIILSFFVFKTNWKKWIKKTVCICSIAFAVVVIAFTAFSLCKAALLAQVLGIVVLIALGIYKCYKKSLKNGIIVSSITAACLVFLILVYCIPALHPGIIGKVVNMIHGYFTSKSSNALMGRFEIWMRYVEHVRGYNFFFGLGKSGVTVYGRAVSLESQGAIHNGIAYFFACYGVFGLFVFAIFLGILLKRVIKCWKISPIYTFLFFFGLVTAFTFILAEAEFLIISTSCPIFIFNVFLCMLPGGMLIKNKEEKKEEILNIKNNQIKEVAA